MSLQKWICDTNYECVQDDQGTWLSQDECLTMGCSQPNIDNSCGNNPNCPCPSKEETVNNLVALAQATGMNQECIKTVENSAWAFMNTTAGAVFPFGGFLSVTTMTGMDQYLNEQGCGSFFMDNRENIVLMNNISCVVNSAKVLSTVDVNANATINIRTVPLTPDLLDSLDRMIVRNADLATQTKNTEALKIIIELQKNIIDKVYNRSLTISGSTVSNIVSGKIVTNIDSNISSNSDLLSDYKNMVKNTANNILTQNYGVSASSPNVKKLVNDRVENKTNNISNTINEIINNQNTIVDSSGEITIEINGPVYILNTTVTNDVTVDLTTKSIATSAVTQGVDLVADLISEANTTTITDQTSAGLEDLQKALAETNEKALAGATNILSAFLSAFTIPIIVGIIGIIVVIIIIVIIFKSIASKSKIKGNYRGMELEYDGSKK